MSDLEIKRTSITIPKRLLTAANERLASHYVTNFSDYVSALIRRDVQEHEAIMERGSHYMPNVLKVPGLKASDVEGGTVMAAKVKSQMPPIVQTIDLDAPLKPQNERRKKAQHHKPQPA